MYFKGCLTYDLMCLSRLYLEILGSRISTRYPRQAGSAGISALIASPLWGAAILRAIPPYPCSTFPWAYKPSSCPNSALLRRDEEISYDEDLTNTLLLASITHPDHSLVALVASKSSTLWSILLILVYISHSNCCKSALVSYAMCKALLRSFMEQSYLTTYLAAFAYRTITLHDCLQRMPMFMLLRSIFRGWSNRDAH